MNHFRECFAEQGHQCSEVRADCPDPTSSDERPRRPRRLRTEPTDRGSLRRRRPLTGRPVRNSSTNNSQEIGEDED